MQSKKTRRIVKSKRYLLKRRAKYLIVAVAAFALVGLLVYYVLGPKSPVIFDTTPKIAIVDQLSTQWPDQTFNQTIQDILKQTGLKIDYYSSKDVTVDFFRDLPRHNYKLIVFRVHSTAESSVEGTPPFVVFFTSENYTNVAHTQEQLDMRLVYCKFPDVETYYFGITPKFVTDSMEGRFNDTTIVAMGCEGLTHDTMAQAFIEKGARAYISWNGSVSIDHTDEATLSLLRHLITEHQTVKESVNQTMNEVGPDPLNESILMFYPVKAGSNFLFVNVTIATRVPIAVPMVRMARKNSNKNNGYSGTTVVPSIFTLREL